MNELCTDIGYKSLNHYGEQLCGDHVEIVSDDDENIIAVLADGLGSGVQASILSTLTSKIISTMMAEGMPLEECVHTIASTLPVRSDLHAAYSTFTIVCIRKNREAEIIQYENPLLILLRDGKNYAYPKTETIVEGKTIIKSRIRLHENDLLIAMSDGCPNANSTNLYNYSWQREDIITFMEALANLGYSAKALAAMLVDECGRLYDNKPIDDVTSMVIRMRKRETVNVLFGPPLDPDDCNRMMTLYFGKRGKHVICGGTTASIAAKFLRKEVRATGKAETPGIPPISSIDGVDLVTEGVITVNRVVEYAKDATGYGERYKEWSVRQDGASMISRLLFDEATDINFFVGRAINPAHQNPDLPVSFNIKLGLVDDLSTELKKMGKRVRVSFF